MYFSIKQPKTLFCHNWTTFSNNFLKIELGNVRVMNILQAKFYSIPIVIENFTAGAHIIYYAHITPSYPTCIMCI